MHPSYGSILKSLREDLNLQFKLMKQHHRNLDDDVFFNQFRSLLLCLPVPAPENANLLIKACFTALLELALQDSSLQLPRSQQVFQFWLDTIPNASELFLKNPSPLIASLANSILFLSEYEGVRIEEYIKNIKQCLPLCKDIETLKRIGVVASWIAGLASIRSQALTHLPILPEEISRILFKDSSLSTRELAEIWKKNPWFNSGTTSNAKSKYCVSGGFSGFGGTFLKPPFIEAQEETFLLSDGYKHWQLSADIFGVTWQRTKIKAEQKPPSLFRLDDFESIYSLAQNAHTIAISIPNSLRVYLKARLV